MVAVAFGLSLVHLSLDSCFRIYERNAISGTCEWSISSLEQVQRCALFKEARNQQYVDWPKNAEVVLVRATRCFYTYREKVN